MVLVLDDILDEGHLHAIIKYLEGRRARGPFRGTGAKETRPQRPTPMREFGSASGGRPFLFGCGMDYTRGYWRNAPGIYALKGH